MNDVVYKSHEVRIMNRDILSLSGINKVINFDNNEFVLSSVMGNIQVKGNNLEILLLDTDKGDLKIKGKIDGISYLSAKKENKETLFSKLFKWLILIHNYLVGLYPF